MVDTCERYFALFPLDTRAKRENDGQVTFAYIYMSTHDNVVEDALVYLALLEVNEFIQIWTVSSCGALSLPGVCPRTP